MNLHFLPDNGFMNYFIEISEKINKPGENIYIIIQPGHKKGTSIIKKVHNKAVLTAKYNSDTFNKYVGNISDYKKMFFHFLTDESCDFIVKNINCTAQMYWLFWGADLYSPFNYFSNFIYDSESLSYHKKYRTFTTSKNYLINFLKYIKAKFLPGFHAKRKLKLKSIAINRINYFCHYNILDFHELKKHFKTNAKFLSFFYFEYDYSKMLNTTSENEQFIINKLKIKGTPIIQIGNSASLSNNHISLIKRLSKLNLQNATIICPLSYGDMRYAKKVNRLGFELLDFHFVPIKSFLNKELYLSLLNLVDVAVMNHMRTEAAGNVFMFLALQKRVVLNGESNLYKYLIENGISVNNLEFLSDNNFEEVIKPLSKQSAEKNYSIISNIFSLENAEENITRLYTSG